MVEGVELSWINLLNSDLLMDTTRMGLYNIVMFKTSSFAKVFSGKCVDWHQLAPLTPLLLHTHKHNPLPYTTQPFLFV